MGLFPGPEARGRRIEESAGELAMALHTFKLPDIGEGIAESEIAAWHVKVGDVIKEEQPLVDMLTEKAAVELPSPVAGKIIELKGNPGDKIPVGGALAVIETDAAGAAKS